jgi:hypothetical protein
MQEAMQALKNKMRGHIDARDVERGTLLSWPDSPRVLVDGDPIPYENEKLVFAEYLKDRDIEGHFQVSEYMEGEEAKGSVSGLLANGTVYDSGSPYESVPRSIIKGIFHIPSPLKAGDRLAVVRMSDQKYYVLGRI